MAHTLTLKSRRPITHDTVELTFDRPKGYDFTPGQANHWGLEESGMRDAGKPFTIVSLPHEDHLTFIVKIYPTDQYPEHDGITEAIGKMEPGDRIFVDDAGGDIRDVGPGVFIAGGAGITPFIPILRERQRQGTLDGCTLIYSNKRKEDIILREEFEAMEGLTTIFTLTKEEDGPHPARKIDGAFLKDVLGPLSGRYYVCGPPPMMEAVIADLTDAGIKEEDIIVEEKWMD